MLLPILGSQHSSTAESDGATIAREFYISALIGLLVWWVSTDFRVHPGELADEFQRLVSNGLRGQASADEGRLLTR